MWIDCKAQALWKCYNGTVWLPFYFSFRVLKRESVYVLMFAACFIARGYRYLYMITPIRKDYTDNTNISFLLFCILYVLGPPPCLNNCIYSPRAICLQHPQPATLNFEPSTTNHKQQTSNFFRNSCNLFFPAPVYIGVSNVLLLTERPFNTSGIRPGSAAEKKMKIISKRLKPFSSSAV